jgi:hypothetical protein
MSLELVVLALLVGWCASDGSRISPIKPEPPLPRPGPWRFVLALLGGLIGAFLILRIWPDAQKGMGMDVLVTALGAWIGSILLVDIVGLFLPSARPDDA